MDLRLALGPKNTFLCLFLEQESLFRVLMGLDMLSVSNQQASFLEQFFVLLCVLNNFR